MAVCDCFDLTEKRIRKAVSEKGLTDADAVYAHFKVETCGSCVDDVTAIVEDEVAKAGA